MITKQEIQKYLFEINKIGSESHYSTIQIYKWFILKEKAIYSTLNMLKNGEKILIGMFWCPTKLMPKMNEMMSAIR